MARPSESKSNGNKTTRRDFIKTSAAVAAGVAAAVPFRPSSGQVLGANEQIGVGFIGVGSRGAGHMREVNAVRERFGIPTKIVAVCDVYRPRLDEAVKVQNVPAAYMDYRELLDDPNVDVVAIGSPDHHHGYHAIDAIRAGKDLYCEKPITHWRQFELTKRLADVVEESDRVFQLGTQGMCDSVWRQMKKLVQDGLIGQPVHGETGFFRVGDWGERGMPVPDPNARPGPDLDWDQFLGDSPRRDFSVDRFFRWRLFEDYAGGPVTDLFPHCVTQVVDVMGVGFPDEVVGIGSIDRYEYELREVPDTFNLLAHYPEQVTIAVLGTSGNDHQTTKHRGSGQRCPVIRGWEGTLTIEGEEIVFTPAGGSKKDPQRFPIEHGEDLILYWKKLFDCVISRDRETWSPMDLAFRTQTMLQMAMLASRAGKTARFDPENREIIV
ncbi:MAG: Gfo/Idh/MocA family oxidoreductase [Phycisphaerales bacterium]|nr:MAG: Gfo/Idh/MocA family oxidoreductase [Phycisphaerales bacterium]